MLLRGGGARRHLLSSAVFAARPLAVGTHTEEGVSTWHFLEVPVTGGELTLFFMLHRLQGVCVSHHGSHPPI